MRSKGGKVEYLCSECNSPDIVKAYSVHVSDMNLIMGLYNSTVRYYFCEHCGNYARWTSRKKVSVTKPPPSVVTDPLRFPTSRWHLSQDEIDSVPTPIPYVAYGLF